MNLWKTIKPFVVSGQEGRKVDLKETLELKTKPQRAEFAKDVMAMANTIGGPGYLVIGVQDAKHRASDNPEDYVVGFDPGSSGVIQQQMVQALEYYAVPIPVVEYHQLVHPDTGHPIGIIHIPRSQARPHRMAVAAEGLPRDAIFVRHGSETAQASFDEMRRLIEGSQREGRIVVNFSGRKITDEQRKQIEELTQQPVDETIEALANLDMDAPFEPQIEALVQEAGLTRSEWESLPLVVNVHALGPAATALLARLHGLCGGFPDILRLRPNPPGSRIWEVFEILSLQRMRDLAWKEYKEG